MVSELQMVRAHDYREAILPLPGPGSGRGMSAWERPGFGGCKPGPFSLPRVLRLGSSAQGPSPRRAGRRTGAWLTVAMALSRAALASGLPAGPKEPIQSTTQRA